MFLTSRFLYCRYFLFNFLAVFLFSIKTEFQYQVSIFLAIRAVSNEIRFFLYMYTVLFAFKTIISKLQKVPFFCFLHPANCYIIVECVCFISVSSELKQIYDDVQLISVLNYLLLGERLFLLLQDCKENNRADENWFLEIIDLTQLPSARPQNILDCSSVEEETIEGSC